MPPKVKITKEDIVRTGLELVQKNGVAALNARSVAAQLGCSTQPIFSNFASMDGLVLAVAEKANALCNDYIQNEVSSGQHPAYKASGMAYIRFAKEEKELFKMLFMCDRKEDNTSTESELSTQMETLVHINTGLSSESAKLFHLEMWGFVHGIAAMFATGFLDLSWELVSRMLSDTYLGLRKQYEMEG